MGRRGINVIGLSVVHNATACLLQDGEIVGCVSEERFNRKKNYLGFPQRSIEFLLDRARLNPDDIDLIVLTSLSPLPIAEEGAHVSRDRLFENIAQLIYRAPYLAPLYDSAHKWVFSPIFRPRWRDEMVKTVSRKSGVPASRIVAIGHHITHAYGPAYGVLGVEDRKDPLLILTNDGNGDGYCAAVNTFSNDSLSLVGAVTPNSASLALVYLQVTQLLGMKPLEHEYKVMGLAPYADLQGAERSYQVLKRLIWLGDDLSFRSAIPSQSYYHWLRERLEKHRFDWVAGAVQRLTEELLCRWISQAIRRSGIRRIALSGGIFMNVKANMAITELPEVEESLFMPSSGDESTPFGAAYWGYQQLCQQKGIPFEPKPLENLYLGPEFSDTEIRQAVGQWPQRAAYKIEEVADMEPRVAQLLAQGKIVARYHGPMEWGARALGNRSILANPSDPSVVRVINEQIKARDFWMPFAPTILKEREQDYISNPKGIEAPYMILAFNTTPLAHKELAAAMHPYDYTARPQVLRREHNPSYHRLIKEFERLTGIGGVLNTSFNLHGEPIVCSPQDALHTLDDSGLEYLALGKLLISKERG